MVYSLGDELLCNQVPLLGDFNSRTGIATDFEHLYEHECSFLEENQFTSYFKQHNIIERVNRDKYINKN